MFSKRQMSSSNTRDLMSASTCDQVVDEVIYVLNCARDRGYAGENVSQLEHALQAADLARNKGGDDEVILAALLHDIGHICCEVSEGDRMGEFGVSGHERIGRAWLERRRFSKNVCDLVESHVPAKRYLCLRFPAYKAMLSSASIATLRYQGGPFSNEHADQFERQPLFDSMIMLRHCDDEAKVVGCEVPDLESYRPMIKQHLLPRFVAKTSE